MARPRVGVSSSAVPTVKPVLQAILLADHVYVDGNTGKHVVAGVFDRLSFIPKERMEKAELAKENLVLGGMQAGSPWAFLSILLGASQWKPFGERTFECRVLLYPETGGGFSAIAARLPGVVSEGETEKEALDNMAEVFQGAVAFYLDERGAIPWAEVAVERTEGCKERWIVVDA